MVSFDSKFSQSAQGEKYTVPYDIKKVPADRIRADSAFVAVMYTSESDKIMRYTDEGETFELCKWTVDLTSLPAFQQNAAVPQPGGFYTGECEIQTMEVLES